MNGDEILYHRAGEGAAEGMPWEVLGKADVVIVADPVSAETLQTIAVKTGEGKLYYYSPAGGEEVA